jgi:hypothetical protein
MRTEKLQSKKMEFLFISRRVFIPLVALLSAQLLTLAVTFFAVATRSQQITVAPSAAPLNERYMLAAKKIDALIPPGSPIVMLVPLNGTPNSDAHLSVMNARIAMEVLSRIPSRERYLVLSEGKTGDYCISGAEITANYLELTEGYNNKRDITVILEKEATTTLENILLSTQLLQERVDTSPEQPIAVIIAGVSDTETFWVGDIGHGARAFLFADWEWNGKKSQKNLHAFGYLPTNLIDPRIKGYPGHYNLQTWMLASTGLLYLPVFDRSGLEPRQCQP